MEYHDRTPLKRLALIFALLVGASPALYAEVTADLRVKIMLAALGFNRTLAAAPDAQVVVGVVGECPTYETLQAAAGKKINGKTISVVKAAEMSYGYLEKAGINVVYLCKISEADGKALIKATARLGVVVLADDPAWVSTHAIMGVKEQDGRPRLRLNTKIAKESKIEFDPRIFGAAEIVE